MIPKSRERRSKVLGVGVLAAVLMVFSAVMGLVSLALYRVEREEIGGDPDADLVADSNR